MDTRNAQDLPPLGPREAGCRVPLTPVQRRIWDWLTKHARTGERFAGASVRIFGELRICALQGAIETVVQRHESLRTRIVAVDGIPEHRVDAPCAWNLQIIDLSRESLLAQKHEETRLAQEFINESVDFSAEPLFSIKVLKLSDREHVLMMGTDHLISDAASAGIVRNEIWNSYGHIAQGKLPCLAPVAVQFADYAVWLHKTSDTWLSEHTAYWTERLRDASLVEFPHEDEIPSVKELLWLFVTRSLGAQLTAQLRDTAWQQRTPLSLVVLALCIAMLARWCNQSDILAKLLIHGRQTHSNLDNTTGLITSFLHLRIKIPLGSCFIDLIKMVNMEFRSACQHYDYGRVPDLFPQCPVSLNFNWMLTHWSRQKERTVQQHNGEVTVTPFPIRRSVFKMTESSPTRVLNVSVFPSDSDTDDGISVSLMYDNDKFSPDTIERVAYTLKSFGEQLLHNPRRPMASLIFPS